MPTKEYLPTWPCSADSSRKQGAPSGSPARSLRKAETGVSQSSTRRARTGTTLPSRASSRASSRLGSSSSSKSAATCIQHLHHPRLGDPARGQQDAEVVEDVGGLFGDPLLALFAGGADHLLGLLLDLLPDHLAIVEQLHRVAAVGALQGAMADRPLQRRQRVVGDRERLPGGRRRVLSRRGRAEPLAVEAAALAGVASRAGGIDQSDEGVAVAVVAKLAQVH